MSPEAAAFESSPVVEKEISFEESSRIGVLYYNKIHKLVGFPIEETAEDTGELDKYFVAGQSFITTQTERATDRVITAKSLLEQLLASGKITQDLIDTAKCDLETPSPGVYIIKIDHESFVKIRPDSQATAVRLRDGVSFILVPKIGDVKRDREIAEENVPHEVHHVFWKGVMEDGVLELDEEDQDLRTSFLTYQDELIARMSSNGRLFGYTHLNSVDPQKRRDFADSDPEKFRTIIDTVSNLNDFLRDLQEEMAIRKINQKTLIGLTIKSRNFKELRDNLTRYKEQILNMPITNPRKQSTGWDYL